GTGGVAVGPLGATPAGPSLPYSPRLGSGALRTSGGSVWAGSRLALSTEGKGTCVTKSPTAAAAASTKIRPVRIPNSVLPPDLEEVLRLLRAISGFYIL